MKPETTKRRFLVVLLAVFLLVGGSMSWLRRASCFALQKIVLDLPSNDHLSSKEALSLTGVPLGKNIFALDLSQIKARLEAHPWVAQAFVSRQLPNKLYIKITLEKAVAMVSTPKGIYLVNEKGRLFAPATPEMLKDLPAIVGLTSAEIAARDIGPRARPLLSLLAYLKKRDTLVPCYANLSQIKLLEEGFLLLTRDAKLVRFKGGDFKELLQEYRHLDKLLAHLYDVQQYARVKSIRLDYPKGKAAISFKEG